LKVWALPFVWFDVVRRRHDYTHLSRLRGVLPPEFWKGLTTAQHLNKMVWQWCLAGGAVLHYHRLGLPYWQKRFHVQGTPPWELAEWGVRPVVVAFLHTGAFTLIPFWIRSRGIPAAFVMGGLPFMADNQAFQNMRCAGDHRYGVDGVPLTFQRRGPAVRDAFRFLRPGRILAMALDGGRISHELDLYDVGGFPFYAKQGACRIAAQTNAIVVPMAISCSSKSPEFEVRFGAPVPDELLRKQDYVGATQHLVTELWKGLKDHPDEISWTALEGVAPELKVKRMGWL
jgi:lauroyl/myristoyl acyltransferase